MGRPPKVKENKVMTDNNTDNLNKEKANALLESFRLHCDTLNITYSANATVSILEDKIKRYYTEQAEEQYKLQNLNKKTVSDLKKDQIYASDAKSKEIIEVAISCNDGELVRHQEGIIVTTGNAVSGILSWYIPIKGEPAKRYKLPRMVAEHLKERQYHIITLNADTSEENGIIDNSKVNVDKYSTFGNQFNITELS